MTTAYADAQTGLCVDAQSEAVVADRSGAARVLYHPKVKPRGFSINANCNKVK